MTTAEQGSRPTVGASIFRNPVALKELRGRMRGSRAFLVMTLYLIVMAALMTLVYLALTAGSGGVSGASARNAGKGVFAAIVAVELFLVVFIGPAFTAGAISGERERQTLDLLRTTLLPANSFVWGKLVSSLSYVILLLIVSIPLQSIAFLLGGLTVTELAISQSVILVAAIAYALFALFCSASLGSTLAATIATLSGMFFITVGLPTVVLAVVLSVSPFVGASGTPSALTQAAIQHLGLTAAATNLPATLITSELLFLEEDAIITFSQVIQGTRYTFFSPWPLFVVLHLLAAFVLFRATVQRVRRVSDS